ncbi:MAG: acetoin utilization protein AcuC [Candidatus Pacearchaeota archaeon]|nr:acetoin utilization protein AcuC [Candidatus Pacearchaeota archaeon]
MIVALDERLKLYSFQNHPFNNKRYEAFANSIKNLEGKIKITKGRKAKLKELLLFHSKEYIYFVKKKSKEGIGYLDCGDTPAFPGCYEATCYVVGTVLKIIEKMLKLNENGFVPVAGLHHAYKNKAAGFCIFNDVCIAINYLRKKYRIKKILYFDIDAHHGDGVFYSFLEDPDVYIVDFHQMPLYPGTGLEIEKGKGKAKKTKLNLVLKPFSTDFDFLRKLKRAEAFLKKIKAEFIIMQAGADCLKKDPLANLCLQNPHKFATELLKKYAKKWKCNIIALGGGGYNIKNCLKAWTSVIKNLI